MAGYDESFFTDGPEGLEFGEEEDRRSLSEQQVPGEGDDLEQAKEFIKEKESFVPTTYMPTPNDVPTIGYGHTGFVDEGQSIDEGEADAMLTKDMGVASKAIDQNVTADLTPDQKNALVSLVMNVGTGAFKNSKALKALNEGDLETFKQEAFSADKGFTKQGDKQLPGLVTRRAEEQTMFEGGPGGYGSEFFKGGPSATEPGTERSQDEQPVPDQGDFSFGEDIVRPTAALVASPFLFIPSKIAEHGYVAGLKFEDWLKDTKNLTPKEQAEVGKGVGDWVASLGGLLTPQTSSAERSVGMVSDVFAPIDKLAHFTAQGVDPEKHPNLHNLLATGVELGAFAGIHSVGKGLKTIATKRAKMMKLEGKERAAAAVNIVKEQERLLKKIESDAKSGKLNKIASDYQAKFFEERASKEALNTELARQKEQAQSAAGKAEEFQQAAIRKRMEEAGELVPKSTGKVAQTAQERQAELEASRPVAAMTVKEKPAELPVAEKPFKSTTELVQEESVRLTKEYKILEDGTVDLVSTEPVGSEFQIQPDGTVETVNQVKPQTVWQTALKPLQNEKGSIDVSRINNKVQRWLKDSHVKDEEGNIRPMFHLAKDNAVIKAGFDPKLSKELGVHFGTEGQIKGMGFDTPSGPADIGIPVLLNIKKPLRLKDAGDFFPRTVVEQLVNHPDIPSKTIDALREGYKRTKGEAFNPKIDQHNNALIRNELQKLGYDGIVYKNVTETVPYDPAIHKFPEPSKALYPPDDLMQDSYIAFKPEQVKGVYDNVISKEPSLASRVLAPLKNERGAINISFNRKKFKEQVSPETRDRVRKISRMAEEAGMGVKDFLLKQGSSKEDVDSFMRLYKLSKEERPMQSAMEQSQKSKGDFEFFKARDGAQQVNVGRDSNTKIVIDNVDAGIVREIPRKGKSLMSYATTADYMFDNYPKLRPLLDQYREISKAIKVDQVAASKHLKQIEKDFPDIKKREDVGVAWHAMSETGRKAMASLGKVIKDNPEYMELKKEIEPLFKDLHDRINEQRVKLGKRAIPEMPDYLSFYAKESLMHDFWNLVKGEKFEQERSNLVMDSAKKIMDRHSKFTKDSTAFNHLHRTGLQKGIKLDLDPLSIYARYLNESLRHVHISPLNAFVHELLNLEHLDPKTNKMLRPVAETNPELHSALKSWNNAIAGMPNLGPLPKNLEKVLNVGMRNMTVAQLFGQLRTVAVQPVALYNTAIKHGMVNTAKGVMDMVRGSKDVPIEKSSVLTTAEMEAGIADINNLIETTKLGKVKEKAIDLTSIPMRKVDYFAREATWRTVYNELKPLVEGGKMTEKEAVRKADSEVIRTQGSGDIGEVSPVQRNVLGKAATLWQTYSINQLNFFMKDVFGTMGAESIGTKARAERIGRALVGGALINTLFEQGLGVQSPLPAPEQALIKGILEGDNWGDTALRTVLEAAEAFPGGGSAKYGSHPLGPVVDLAGKITGVLKEDGYDPQSVVSKALGGDKKALLIVTDIVGSMMGVPGTKQATKYIRARDRGESVPGALMGRYDKKRKKNKWK